MRLPSKPIVFDIALSEKSSVVTKRRLAKPVYRFVGRMGKCTANIWILEIVHVLC